MTKSSYFWKLASKGNIPIYFALFIDVFCSTSDTQLAIFQGLELKRLFKCLELFVGWLQGGLYDFSNLPVSVFKQMDEKDIKELEKIPEEYLCM